ncbi:MAG: hypothetical protein HY719_17990 [Planctomycetes bacterium]|nr:hypothetical protein [Planctomycetota bacterium]
MNHPRRVYHPDKKHKRGATGEGPPRWFPDSASKCPDDLCQQTAQHLLDGAIEGRDHAHPGKKALYAVHAGEFFKAYPSSPRPSVESPAGVKPAANHAEEEVWHGYLVERAMVPRQVPNRVLKEFLKRNKITRAEYTRLLGSAR